MSPTTASHDTRPETTKRQPTRKPGSGRPGQSRRKPKMSVIPNIRLIESGTMTVSRGSRRPHWSNHEYEQLCFDLLHEQRLDGPYSESRDDVSPTQTRMTTELRLPDRTASNQPKKHLYETDTFKRQRTSSAHLPDAKRWSSQFTCAYIEVLGGRRPIRQIERWLDERMTRQVKSEVNYRLAHQPRNFTIYSLHVSEPIDSVIEGSCLLRTDDKYHVMTFRFEGWDGRWMCTHLRIHA